MMVVALGASVYYAFAIAWPTMVFSLYTSDLTHGAYLYCTTGCGTNAGQIIGGTVCRQLGRQKMQIVVTAICMGTFLGRKTSPTLKLFALIFSNSLATLILLPTKIMLLSGALFLMPPPDTSLWAACCNFKLWGHVQHINQVKKG